MQILRNLPIDFLDKALSSHPPGPVPQAQSQVVVGGNVTDMAGVPPYFALVIAVSPFFQVVNFTAADTNGHYKLGLQNSTSYYLISFTGSAASVNSYYLHGHLPSGRSIHTENGTLVQNFKLENAFDLILEIYNKGALVDNTTFTSQRFATDLNDSTAPSVFLDTDKGKPPKIPCLIVPISQPRKIFLQQEVPGFGRVMLRADNGGKGYAKSIIDGIVLNMNYEFAKTRYRLLDETYNSYKSQGYSVSQRVTDLMGLASSALDQATQETIAPNKANYSDVSLNYSCWASEFLTMDRAQQDIQKYRTGGLTVKITDTLGNPAPLVTAKLNLTQTARDFDFGIFDNVNEVGNATFEKFKEMGGNYATEGFYWSISEPQKGQYAWSDLNNSVGVIPLSDRGFRLKAHALCYLLDLVTPGYLKYMNFSELNATVYEHVNNLSRAYKDYISVWEASNEAHGIGANRGLNRTEMTEIIKTSAKAIRDAVPGAFVTVNSGFDWFGQSKMGSYLIGGDNFSLPIPQYLDYLLPNVHALDGIEQQMYDGGHSDFGGLWSMDVPTYDMFELSSIADRLDSYGKPVRISEQSVSGSWNDSWKNAGYLHEKWSPKSQADFVRLFYTVMFSKKNFRGITWWDASDNNSFMANGGLFDENLNPKPAMYALRDLIDSWTTRINASFDGSAPRKSTVFAGNYSINISYDVPGIGTKWLNYSDYHIGEGEGREINITVNMTNIPTDLKVTEFTYFPQYVFEGDLVKINATIMNDGPIDKNSITVGFLLNSLPLWGQKINLTAGSSQQLSTDLLAGQMAFSIDVSVDPSWEINDYNRSNNNRTLWITVQGRPPKMPDLSIDSKSIGVSSSNITVGDTVTFSAVVSNHGNAAAISANVTFYDGNPDSGGSVIGRIKKISNVAIGGDVTVYSDPWTASPMGTHSIYVRVDSCAPAESDISDNIAFKSIQVNQKPVITKTIDLVVTQIALSKPSPVEGDNITISVSVANLGNQDAFSVILQIKYDTLPLAEKQYSAVAAGDSATYNVVWQAVKGSHRINATVDPQNTIKETYEQNNVLYKDITVSGKQAPPPPPAEEEPLSIADYSMCMIFVVIAAISAVVAIIFMRSGKK